MKPKFTKQTFTFIFTLILKVKPVKLLLFVLFGGFPQDEVGGFLIGGPPGGRSLNSASLPLPGAVATLQKQLTEVQSFPLSHLKLEN